METLKVMIYQFTLITVFSYFGHYLPNMDLPDLFQQKVRPAMAALAIMENHPDGNISFDVFGSAVCIDPSGIFLTANHCIINDAYLDIEDIKEEIEIEGKNLNIVQCTLDPAQKNWEIKYARPKWFVGMKDYDVAALALENKHNIPFSYLNLRTDGLIREGETVGCAGYPSFTSKSFEINPSVFQGIISRLGVKIDKGRITCEDIIVDMSLHRGNSGGPIFDSKGQLIAVVSQQDLRPSENTDDPVYTWTNMIHCVPYTCFYDIIDHVKKIKGEKEE